MCVEYIIGDDGLPIEQRTDLQGNGDFRSPECISLLQESDIICTNPPFSLFREYLAQLMEYKKDFLIIGSANAITYKETFNYIIQEKVWLGNTNVKEFRKPNGEIKKFGNICWYTNLTHKKRNEEIKLWKEYDGFNYHKYDGFDILNVNKVNEIPKNYIGLLGVPITFLEKYNPNQFKILGIANSARYIGEKCYTLINGKKIYNRIIIKQK